jgi:hypothetical protein
MEINSVKLFLRFSKLIAFRQITVLMLVFWYQSETKIIYKRRQKIEIAN